MKPSLLLHLTLFGLPLLASAIEPCRVRVVDAENGWPVPLVELRTTHNVSFFTDNAGVVAFDLPELLGTETWFTVAADGYEAKADRFGSRGFRFTPEPGGEYEFKITRTIVAKRLGRLTGGGIFGESQKLGDHADWKESGILGSDSVQNYVHGGKMFWAWGDTIVPRYPLGLFHMVSATTAVQPLTSFEPPLELALQYFRDAEGRVRNVANVAPEDPGPTWISGYVSLPDAAGKEKLVGVYSKIEIPLTSYRVGLCVWNDETANFESVEVLWDKKEGGSEPKLQPVGHPSFWTDEEGKRWLLFGDPFPSIRMPATFEAWRDRTQWESLTPQKSLKSAEDRKIIPHRGSIAWNDYRKRWVTVFGEHSGDPSFLGELWYAESDSPLGPWGTAVKVVSHRKLTFYNPRLHPEFTPTDSPILLFEGTYTQSFSAETRQTPRHDYNQILYRLDLDDPKLGPAQGR
ncbi:MAG TPA: hypothetical protein PK648_00110 [Verrucomicrobiales bacterium]|jgi:hypothetical protein|nr:hypothetical protein [Verrucomicrobiales bacterium]